MSALILGIDPATRCGWALLDEDGQRIDSGTWLLCHHVDHATRVQSLDDALRALAAEYDGQIAVVSYEATNTHKSRAQARVAYALEAVILLAAARYDWAAVNPTATQIKALATGATQASKDAMVERAREAWGEVDAHDEADALWAAEWGRRNVRIGEVAA